VSGTLEEGLAGIIQRLEELQRLRWRTFSMCLYPAWLLVAFLIGGAFMKVGGSKEAAKLDSLPLALAGSLGVRVLKVTMIGLALFSAPLALAALGLEERWERVRVHLPLLGAYYRRTQAGRFCQVLGSSLGAGVDAERSLRMAIEATGSTDLRSRAHLAVQRLRDGATLTDVVEWLGVLDGESLRHVGIGERSGRMEILLQQQARVNSEAGLRSLMALMIGIVVVLVVVLLATSIAGIFESQQNYFDRIEKLSHG
jgi:type II secretory pathway component PulF